nr:MAG TPA: hypothetical protein [Inoviridae sp.]
MRPRFNILFPLSPLAVAPGQSDRPAVQRMPYGGALL